MGLVLGGDADATNAGVDRVGKREIDDAGFAAEIDGWLCAPLRELGQAAAAAAGQNISHRITCQGLSTPVDHLRSP